MSPSDTPVVLNQKLYVRGTSKRGPTVLEYTPDHDQWTELPPPPVKYFSLATLKGQLLLVGGKDSSNKTINAIYSVVESPEPRYQLYSALPMELIFPTVLEHQGCLIVAGGRNTMDSGVSEVNVLDTINNKWTTALSLPRTDDYNTVLIKDTVYLVGQNTRTVLRAHVPTLISGANRSDLWTLLPDAPYYWSSPITIGNNLLTVGGCIDTSIGKPTFDIQLYGPTSNQWVKVGTLPEPLCTCHCANYSGKLFVLGGNNTKSPESLIHSVYLCTPLLEHCL